MAKKTIKLPTAEDSRKKMEKVRKEQEKAAEEKKKQDAIPVPVRDPDEVAYEEMLQKIEYEISYAINHLEDSCIIQLGTRRFENEKNSRTRKALEKIRPILTEKGYSTCWRYDRVEDDGFNRDIYDEFCIGWNPSFRWIRDIG
jgi:hypothetical protein